MDWLVYSIVVEIPLDFTKNPPNDSSHHIMMFPKFIDLSMKSDNSGSYAVRSEMEWLVHSIVPLDFTKNPPNDSSHHIMMFPKFIDLSMKSDNSGSYAVRSEMEWLVHSIVFYRLDFTQNQRNDSSHHIMMFPNFGLNPISIGPRNRTIQVRRQFALKWSGWCIL
ncbi:unnamed protein product [Prunus brigantina]